MSHQTPLSPVSVASSGWSGVGQYQSAPHDFPGPRGGRSNLPTPPTSTSSIGMMNGGPPNGLLNGRPGEYRGHPSPPSSQGRLSSSSTTSVDAQRRKQAILEEGLSRHYIVLKSFLADELRATRAEGKHNKARDKLLRLSAVQFQELSTDVFDELQRRQSAANAPPGTPNFLVPKDNFHPKRNQARQKLSTLPDSRFRALATDVYFELERRFPRFEGRDVNRTDSPINNMRGAPPDGTGISMGSRPGHSPRKPSIQGQVFGGGLGVPSAMGADGYATQKSSQSNTVVPNKSYMVEEDSESETASIYGMSRRDTTNTNRSYGGDARIISDYQNKVEDLQKQLQGRDATIERLESSPQGQTGADWEQLQKDLEAKLASVHALNDNLQAEIDRAKVDLADMQRGHTDAAELRARQEDLLADHQDLKEAHDRLRQSHEELMAVHTNVKRQLEESSNGGEWRSRYDALQQELKQQQKVTDEVRIEAAGFLAEMKAISERTDESWQREEKLSQQAQRLEAEVKDWKSRYAKVKAQLRSARTASMGLSSQQPTIGQNVRSPSGLVNDVDITKFQIAIDDLLRIARLGQAETMIQHMKDAINAVQAIIADVSSATDSKTARLRRRVSNTANNLITASINHASSRGISPISLLDAAASHLSTSIVELCSAVKVRPSRDEETLSEDEEDERDDDYYGLGDDDARGSIADSVADNTIPPPEALSSAAYHLPSAAYSRPAVSTAFAGDGRQAPTQVVEDLKHFLDEQTSQLINTIQSLVTTIRASAPASEIRAQLGILSSSTSTILSHTQAVLKSSPSGSALTDAAAPLVSSLAQSQTRLDRAQEAGRMLSTTDDEEWKDWIQGLPPIAFGVVREVKNLVTRVGELMEGRR